MLVEVEVEVLVEVEGEGGKVEAVRGVDVVDEAAVVGAVVTMVFPPEASSDSFE